MTQLGRNRDCLTASRGSFSIRRRRPLTIRPVTYYFLRDFLLRCPEVIGRKRMRDIFQRHHHFLTKALTKTRSVATSQRKWALPRKLSTEAAGALFPNVNLPRIADSFNVT